MRDYNKNNTDAHLERLIDGDKISMTETYEKNFQTQENTLDTLESGLRHARLNNFKDSALIWNVAVYVNIISYDLKIITRDLTFAKSEWQKRHYARQASLLMYESINDLSDLLGKKFIDLVENRINTVDILGDLKDYRSDVSYFRRCYYDKLKTIRNVSIGHRDNEVLKQIELIEQIIWSDAIGMITQYDAIINKLGRYLTNLMHKAVAELPELKR